MARLMVAACSAGAAGQVALERHEAHDEAAPARQALGVHQDDRRRRPAGPAWPAASWCRRCGRRTAPTRLRLPAAPGPAARRSARRFSGVLARIRTPDRLAGARCRLWRARAPSISGFRAALLGRAVHHGERRAQRDLLRGDFEAAQVRRQEHDAAAGVEHRLHVLPVLVGGVARHALRRARTRRTAARRSPCRIRPRRCARWLPKPAPLQVGAQAAAVGGRSQVDQPAQRGAQASAGRARAVRTTDGKE